MEKRTLVETGESFDRTQETSHDYYYIKRLTFNHSLIVIRDKYTNKLFYSGKVNHHRFQILINGQVCKGELATSKKDTVMIAAIIAETEIAVEALERTEVNTNTVGTPKYAGQCLVCEHYDWTSCKCNIGKMRLFSIRNGFIKCDKKRAGAMPGLEILTDAHGVTNDDYVFADKVHTANGFKFNYIDVYINGDGIAEIEANVIYVDIEIMREYSNLIARMDYFINEIAEHYMRALSSEQGNMTPNDYLVNV